MDIICVAAIRLAASCCCIGAIGPAISADAPARKQTSKETIERM